jgi:outer membrane protein
MHPIKNALIPTLLTAVMCLPAQAQTAPLKFAYINSQVILERAPGRAEAATQFNKEREALQSSIEKMTDSLKAMFDAYNKEQATLAPSAKEAREKSLREKQTEFDTRVGQMDQQMQQRQFELMQPIMNQIREVLEAIRNEEGFTFVFDVAAEGGTIVAADKNLDITERVIARLKPIPVSVTPRSDSTKAGAARPAPAGITRPPTRPPSR